MDSLLKVRNLRTQFTVDGGSFYAVDGMDLDVHRGEVVAVVGESGSGKSVTSLSVMGLVPNPPGRIVEGEILFNGEDLLKKSKRQMQDIRGDRISMIFQEPMTSLNPVYSIGKQIVETLIRHKKMSGKQAAGRAREMLEWVGIPAAEERLRAYPHQLSGGMRQRVMIAMALACEPELLIADEPTTALDVTIEAQILDLMLRLKQRVNTAILLITHDMGVVADIAESVVVMYCGRVVEKGPVQEIFENPLHPYTQGLLQSIPRMEEKKERLFMIPGMVPNPLKMPPGCAFSARCRECMDICRQHAPPLSQVDGRHVRCYKHVQSKVGRV